MAIPPPASRPPEAAGSDFFSLAAGAGALLVTVATGIGGLTGAMPAQGEALMNIAALAASYAAIRLECDRLGDRIDDEDYSPRVAKHMALGAAHGSMLSRIARRTSDTAET